MMMMNAQNDDSNTSPNINSDGLFVRPVKIIIVLSMLKYHQNLLVVVLQLFMKMIFNLKFN